MPQQGIETSTSVQTLGFMRGLPGTGYRKGIDAHDRCVAMLEPVIASALDKYIDATKSGNGSGKASQDADCALSALFAKLAAGDLPLETPEGRSQALAMAHDAVFLLFAGACCVPPRLDVPSWQCLQHDLLVRVFPTPVTLHHEHVFLQRVPSALKESALQVWTHLQWP